MVAIGQMRRGSEEYNRRKNIITRALGIGREVEPDFFEVDLEGGDYILLCSDGLSNMLEDQSMYATITGEGSLKEKAALLIEEANRQGGIDNIAPVVCAATLLWFFSSGYGSRANIGDALLLFVPILG